MKLALALAAAMCVVGCNTERPVNDLKTVDDLARALIASDEHLTSILQSITDVASFDAAEPRLEKAVNRAAELHAKLSTFNPTETAPKLLEQKYPEMVPVRQQLELARQVAYKKVPTRRNKLDFLLAKARFPAFSAGRPDATMQKT